MSDFNDVDHCNETNDAGRGPFFVNDPLSELTETERKKFAETLSDRSRATYHARLCELSKAAEEMAPLNMLAILSYYGLMGTVEEAASSGRRPNQSTGILQSYIEFFQALLLQKSSGNGNPPYPQLSQQVIDALPDLFEAYAFKQMPLQDSNEDAQLPSKASGIRFLSSALKNHTALVRNWGYFSAIHRITKELISPIDADFKSSFGLSLSEILSVFEYLVRRLENEISLGILQPLHRIFKETTPRALADTLSSEYSGIKHIEQIAEIIKRDDLCIDQAKNASIIAVESYLPTLFLLEASEVAQELNFDPDTISKLFKKLALSFGELADFETEKFFLENPVWTRPLISLGENVYFCAVPQTLTSFAVNIIDDLVEAYPKIQERMLKRRANFLEDRTEQLLKEAFPTCKVVRGYKWKESGVQYESDIIVHFDSMVILVEAKSGRVSWPALRGRPDRILRDVNELIVRPSDQSGRLAKRIREKISGETSSSIEDFPVDLNSVRSVIRLSVTLQDFATIQSVPAMMEEAGLIKSEYPLAPWLTLSDLEVAIDILDTHYVRAHYFRQRATLTANTRLYGDELDSIGLYLDTGMNLSHFDYSERRISMVGYSAAIDEFYIKKDEGINAKKPTANINSFIGYLCDRLAERAFTGWLEIVNHLLNLPIDQQNQIEDKLNGDQKQIIERSEKNAENIALVAIPHDNKSVSFFFYFHTDHNRSTRQAAEGFSNSAFNFHHVETCVVIGLYPNKDSLKYNSCIVMARADRPVSTHTFL